MTTTAATARANGNGNGMGTTTSALEAMLAEVEGLRKDQSEQAAAAREAIGGQVLDLAQEGMSTVGRVKFDLTYRNPLGSAAVAALQGLSYYSAIKNEGPAIVAAVKGLLK